MRASLMGAYQLRLTEARTWPAREVADLVEWLPPGCPLWLAVGGPASLSAEHHELRHIAYWLRVLDYRERGSKGEKPTPAPQPEWAHERRAAADTMSRKARAHARRQAAS